MVDEPGFDNQVKNLSDQIELISKKLGSLSPLMNKDLSWLMIKRKLPNKSG
jgi:hypothetical protein